MTELHRLLPGPSIQTDPVDRRRIEERGFDRAWDKARSMNPSEVVQEVSESRILGRGGAAFPTGRKWQAVSTASSSVRYVVMNADESEPGTFKDRVLLTNDPFGPLVGMLIAAYAVQAKKAFIYIRGEYRDTEHTLLTALEQLKERGWIGPHALTVEIRRGAGAYVAGEETGLFNSMEGFRPEPRVKPPFPTQAGLWGKPTLIQNVETFANIAALFAHGREQYEAAGTPLTPGTKLFSVSGHVHRPGVYELPFGTPLSQLLTLSGGIAGSGRLQAVLLGGAAGTFLTARESEQAILDYAPLKSMGAGIGSGAVMVFDDSTNLHQVLMRLSRFFADESCGQCVPCRIGSRRLWEAVKAGPDTVRDREWDLRALSRTMQDASICGLGQAAPLALLSYLDRPQLMDKNAQGGPS